MWGRIERSGISVEYNQLLRRTSVALPRRELAIKVMKVGVTEESEIQDAEGHRLEVKHLETITMLVPKVFVFDGTFFFLMEIRGSKFNFITKWSPCVLQLAAFQLRIYRNLADIAQENTVSRVNLHSLMVGAWTRAEQ